MAVEIHPDRALEIGAFLDLEGARGIYKAAEAHSSFEGDGRPKALVLMASPQADFNGFFSRSELETVLEGVARKCDMACRIILTPEDITREVTLLGGDVAELILIGHGTPQSISLDSKPGASSALTTAHIAHEMFTGLSKDAGITLFACAAGKGRFSLAETITHHLERPVSASHRNIYVGSFGVSEEGKPRFIHEVTSHPGSITLNETSIPYVRKTYVNETNFDFEPEIVFYADSSEIFAAGTPKEFFETVIAADLPDKEKILLVDEYCVMNVSSLREICAQIDPANPLHEMILKRIQMRHIARWLKAPLETRTEMYYILTYPEIVPDEAMRGSIPFPSDETKKEYEALIEFCTLTGLSELPEGEKLITSIRIALLLEERDPETISILLERIAENTLILFDIDTMLVIAEHAYREKNMTLLSQLLCRLAQLPFYKELLTYLQSLVLQERRWDPIDLGELVSAPTATPL